MMERVRMTEGKRRRMERAMKENGSRRRMEKRGSKL
jgi:hypothetical protein